MRDQNDISEHLIQSIPGAMCAREYYALKEGEHIPIIVVLYFPEIEGPMAVCRFTIKGAGLEIDDRAGGPDRLGAILHALFGIRTHLESLPWDVTWLGPPRMLNLPMNMSNGFGSHFERHCEELVAAEHEWASANRSETRQRWAELPNRKYEDCPGYLESVSD